MVQYLHFGGPEIPIDYTTIFVYRNHGNVMVFNIPLISHDSLIFSQYTAICVAKSTLTVFNDAWTFKPLTWFALYSHYIPTTLW